jgi:cob(I)alamin adenosyltransferase
MHINFLYRAERSVYPLIHAEQVDAEVGRYLNRLSDFLFAATRAAALREGREVYIYMFLFVCMYIYI